jgi:hypothetical protein
MENTHRVPMSAVAWGVAKFFGLIVLVALLILTVLTLALFLGPTSHDGEVGPATSRVVHL